MLPKRYVTGGFLYEKIFSGKAIDEVCPIIHQDIHHIHFLSIYPDEGFRSRYEMGGILKVSSKRGNAFNRNKNKLWLAASFIS